jgi:transcriptional regulator with XRE-family HTH domain
LIGGPSAFQNERGRLAAELKRLRERAGLTQREVASRVGWSQSKVVFLETARRSAKPGDVAAWAQALGLRAEEAEELVQRAERAQAEVVNWRRALREGPAGLDGLQREWAALERLARTFREYQPLLVPGLLQTAEYARRAFLAEEPDRDDIGVAVAARLERQTILYEPSHSFEFLLSEAALRWRVGPQPVHVAQLDRIQQVATLSNVHLGVIPMDVEAAIWRYHPFVMLEDLRDEEGADEDDLVLAETLSYNVFVRDEETVERYRQAFRRLQGVALTGEPAARILRAAQTPPG